MMKMIVFTLLVISCTLVNGYHVQSTTFEDFPNQCASDITINKSFVRIGKKYYYIGGTEKMSWYAAAHFCRTLDANLATIENADEMHFISQHLLSKGFKSEHWFWTSGNDLATEGKFQFLSTGKPLSYTKWSPGQPDNMGGRENCVHLWIHASEFYMNDWECHQQAYYICEANTPKTIAITIW